MRIEMHCHTLFSVDGVGSPEALVDAAVRRGVSVLSITEHNHLGSYPRAREWAEGYGLRYLPGVEMDGLWRGRALHFLAYGFDPQHPALAEVLDHNFSVYERRWRRCAHHLRAMGYVVDEAAMAADLPLRYPGHPAPILNRWFARQWLVQREVFAGAAEAREALMAAERRVQAEQEQGADLSFAPFETVRDAVHAAKGVVVLAHVARYAPGDGGLQVALLHQLIELGLDGFELDHPSNRAEPQFERLVRVARRLNCVVTGGSDCHDARRGTPRALGSSRLSPRMLGRLEEALGLGMAMA